VREKRTYRWLGWCLRGCFVAALVAILGSAARADEWAFDAYVGPNFPNDDAGGGEATAGGRIGYWYSLADEVDLGFYVDSGAVLAESGRTDLTMVPTSFLFMARVPLLRTDEIPAGRLQPYTGVGPSVVWSRAERDAQSDTSVDAGVDVRVGAFWMFFESFGVFSEYRFTYAKPDYDGFFPASQKFEFDGDLPIHHLLFGAAFRF
jgi:hypothetical protein